MPITIEQLITVAAPAVINEFRRPYRLGPIWTTQTGWQTSLYDTHSQAGVSIIWSREDEFHLRNERQRIDFVKALLENAIHSLDLFTRRHEAVPFGDLPNADQQRVRDAWTIPAQEPVEEPAIDVDFDS